MAEWDWLPEAEREQARRRAMEWAQRILDEDAAKSVAGRLQLARRERAEQVYLGEAVGGPAAPAASFLGVEEAIEDIRRPPEPEPVREQRVLGTEVEVPDRPLETVERRPGWFEAAGERFDRGWDAAGPLGRRWQSALAGMRQPPSESGDGRVLGEGVDEETGRLSKDIEAELGARAAQQLTEPERRMRAGRERMLPRNEAEMRRQLVELAADRVEAIEAELTPGPPAPKMPDEGRRLPTPQAEAEMRREAARVKADRREAVESEALPAVGGADDGPAGLPSPAEEAALRRRLVLRAALTAWRAMQRDPEESRGGLRWMPPSLPSPAAEALMRRERSRIETGLVGIPPELLAGDMADPWRRPSLPSPAEEAAARRELADRVRGPRTVAELLQRAEDSVPADAPVELGLGPYGVLGGAALETLGAVTWGTATAGDETARFGLEAWEGMRAFIGGSPRAREEFRALRSLVRTAEPDTALGDGVAALVQFLVPFSGALQTANLVHRGGRWVAGAVKGAAAGAVVDYAAFDPHGVRLATLLNEHPYLEPVVSDWMASSDPDSPAWEGRVKNAVEGTVLGGTAELVFRGLGLWVKAKRTGRPETGLNGVERATGREEARAIAEAETKAVVGTADDTEAATLGEAVGILGGIRARLRARRAERAKPKTEKAAGQLGEVRTQLRAERAERAADGPDEGWAKRDERRRDERTRQPNVVRLAAVKHGARALAEDPPAESAKVLSEAGFDGEESVAEILEELGQRRLPVGAQRPIQTAARTQPVPDPDTPEGEVLPATGGMDDGPAGLPAFDQPPGETMAEGAAREAETRALIGGAKPEVLPWRPMTEDLTRGHGIREGLGLGTPDLPALVTFTEEGVSLIRVPGLEDLRAAALPGMQGYENLEAAGSVARLMDDTVYLRGEHGRRAELAARQTNVLDPQAMLGGDASTPAMDLRILLELGQRVGRSAHRLNQRGSRAVDRFAREVLHYHMVGRQLAGDAEGAERLLQILEQPFREGIGRTASAAVDRLGGTMAVRALAGVVNNADTLDAGLRESRNALYFGAGDNQTLLKKALTVRASAMLSSPRTVIRDTIGNTVPLVLQIPETFAGSLIRLGSDRNVSVNAADLYLDTYTRLSGMMQGLKFGWRIAKIDAGTTSTLMPLPKRQRLWDKAKAEDLQQILRDFSRRPKGEIPGEYVSGESLSLTEEAGFAMPWRTGRTVETHPVIQTPFIALQASTNVFKGMQFWGELHYQAHRAGRERGLRGKALKDFVVERTTNLDRTKAGYQRALLEAERSTFTNDPGALGQLVVDLANIGGGVGRLAIPFPRTPMNILETTVERVPGLNLASGRFWGAVSEGGDEARRAWGRVAVGASVLWAGWQLAEADRVTGCAPPGAWVKTPVPQCSYRTGDTWTSYRTMPVVNGMLAGGASMAQLFHAAETDEERSMVLGAFLTLSHTVGMSLRESPLGDVSVLTKLIEAVGQEEPNVDMLRRELVNVVGSFSPAQALRRDLSGGFYASDTYVQESGRPDTWVAEEMRRIGLEGGSVLDLVDQVVNKLVPELRLLRDEGYPPVNVLGDDVTWQSPGTLRDADGQEVTIPQAITMAALGPNAAIAHEDSIVSNGILSLGGGVLRNWPRNLRWTVPGGGGVVEVTLLPEERRFLHKTSGKELRRLLDGYIGSGRWEEQNHAERVSWVQAYQQQAQRDGVEALKERYPRLHDEVEQVPIRIQHRRDKP